MTDQSHPNRPFQIFLSHSSADKAAVEDIYRRLKADGFSLWLDEVDTLPDQDWQREIEAAVDASDIILVCLSRNSVTREGNVQKEIALALDLVQKHRPGILCIIPVRLDEVNLPPRLMNWYSVDFFRPNGHAQLLAALINLVNPSSTTTQLDIQSNPSEISSADFSISFDPDLSPEQIRSTLQLLADYYRACGGVGFEIDFELEEAYSTELANV